MPKSKKIYIIAEMYRPLESWLIQDNPPQGMPAVYNLFQYLGNHQVYSFYSILYNRQIDKNIVFPNGSIIHLKKRSFPNYHIWKIEVFLKLYFGKHKYLQENKVDLIYGLSTFSLIARHLGKKYNIKSIGRIYGTILTKLVRQRNYSQLYSRYLLDILNICQPPDTIIATKDGTNYDQVCAHFNSNLKPIMMYNGIDADIKSSLLLTSVVSTVPINKTIKICQIARLESYKRVHISTDIINILVNEYHIRNILLTIVGSGSLKNDIRNKISENNLSQYIVLKDEMEHADILEFIKTQDIATFFYEGGSLGNIYWECSLAGLLICTVDNGDTSSVMQDGINGIIKNDDKNLTSSIAKDLNNLLGKDISHITEANRKLISAKIKSWEERFDKEFDLLLNNHN